MTVTFVGASRQSAILALVGGLHVAAFLLAASGMLPRLLEVLPTPPVAYVVPRPPEPVTRVQPVVPLPGDYVPARAPLPDLDIPRKMDEKPPAGAAFDTGTVMGGSGSALPGATFEPPALRMRDSRLASLIDACYPSAARRLGEEGRAVARIAVDAKGRPASWSLAQGSGFPRLDAALECVIRRLQFAPGRRDGLAVGAEVRLPIVFQLN